MTALSIRRCGIALLAIAALLAGCAAPAHKESMAPVALTPANKHPHTVRVETRGGAETGVMDSSNIGNADLKAAIETSIRQSGLFKSVVQGKEGDYELTVNIIQLDKPLFGGAFTVTLETGWTLAKAADRSIVLRKAVRTSHTATMSDSFVGVTRLRLAVEGAVRENIRQGLQAVSEAKL
jgi:hypothetical protein